MGVDFFFFSKKFLKKNKNIFFSKIFFFWIFFFFFFLGPTCAESRIFAVFQHFSSFFIIFSTPKSTFFDCFPSSFIIKRQFLVPFLLRIDVVWSQVRFPYFCDALLLSVPRFFRWRFLKKTCFSGFFVDFWWFLMVFATFMWILAQMIKKRSCFTGSFSTIIQGKISFSQRKSMENTSKWWEMIPKSVRKVENRFWVFFFICLCFFHDFSMIFDDFR